MTTTPPLGPIVVGINLDGEIAEALEAAIGRTLDSRAAYMRRALVEKLRDEGLLHPPTAGPRPSPRTRRSGRR